jgi:hypothetical protein
MGEPSTTAQDAMMSASSAVDKLLPLGFQRVEAIPGSTYKDNSTVIIIPTRGMISYRVVNSWQALITPMNQKRAILFAVGDEVGHAYDKMVRDILAHPELSKWKYIMTLEDDNLIPPDAHLKLLESLQWSGFDGMGGLYFTKGEINMPMAYGNPRTYADTGVLEFAPLDVTKAIKAGSIVEVNGIAMGCSLYRMDLFREVPSPWFVTTTDTTHDKLPGTSEFSTHPAMTQDLFFCKQAKLKGKRFGVDTRVKVGHLDINTGVVY